MKYFKKITTEEGSNSKTWKSTEKVICTYCKKEIDKKRDYFELKAYWKIKNKPDTRNFCSLRCLKKWTGESE
ncbi:MAG: hypothetical protein NTV63_00705 [Candidatus Woesearchaeota archaeon]|nr:hypothetical protein [Candidatus Woesearchaeota archaeon]